MKSTISTQWILNWYNLASNPVDTIMNHRKHHDKHLTNTEKSKHVSAEVVSAHCAHGQD